MDRYSFLNAAHTGYFSDLYDQYLRNPDSVEPSWRAFFQGFDFGLESQLEALDVQPTVSGETAIINGQEVAIPQTIQKEFSVIRLINGYRSRGHLFTQTNPVRERRKYEPTLHIGEFDLEEVDLDTIFDSGNSIGIGPSALRKIIENL